MSEEEYRHMLYLSALYYEYHCERFDIKQAGYQGKGGSWIPFNTGKASKNARYVLRKTLELFPFKWSEIRRQLRQFQNMTFFELQSIYLRHEHEMPKREPVRIVEGYLEILTAESEAGNEMR